MNSVHASLASTLLLLGAAGTSLAGAKRDAELVPAIRASDYDKVALLLEGRSADPNKTAPDGSTPLSWAVETQDPQMVRLLLNGKANPGAATNPAVAPLMLACEHGNGEILNLLLDAGADVKLVREGGASPLSLCAGTAPTDVVSRLLQNGATLDAKDSVGQTPLMWAAAKGRIDTVKLLLAKGADVNAVSGGGLTPLFYALKSGNHQLSHVVLEAGGSPEHIGPLGTNVTQLAIFQGDFAFAKRMIERRVDVEELDANGHTLLLAAVSANQPELVQLLLEKGANPNQWSGTSKVKWGYEPNFRNIDYVQPSKAPLLVAAEKGAAKVIDLLVAAGADVKAKMPDDGTTVVHAAIRSERLEAVAAALRARPEVDVQDNKGDTPLHALLALRRYPGSEAEQILGLLAEKGARTDIKNKKGEVAEDLTLEGRGTDLRQTYVAVFGQRTAGR